MAPIHAKRGRRTGRKDARHQKKIYRASRLQNSDDELEIQPDEDIAEDPEDELEEASSEDEVQVKKQDAYAALLQAFGQTVQDEEPVRKKRRLSVDGVPKQDRKGGPNEVGGDENTVIRPDQSVADDLAEPAAEDEEDDDADEDEDASDAFEVQFANADENVLTRRLKDVNEKKWHTTSFTRASGKWTISALEDSAPKDLSYDKTFPTSENPKIKQRLIESAKITLHDLQDVEEGFASQVMGYKDVLYAGRTVSNSSKLRSITCLHVLNHIFKTRDRVIKNNTRLAKASADSFLECRDQGFTRPKVLVLLPTRQSCVRYIDRIVQLSKPEQQENKKRFEESYVADEEMTMDRPDDYRELFAGNNDDMFRIGVKFTRKTIKFFSQFYNSDMIIASPLGLRQAISGKNPDKDFLSSIEMLIVDQADALLMQNWEHVLHIFEHLNQQPKEAHGCDFSRVRSWYLDGNARFLRQNIIMSAYLAPHHLALFSTHAQNIAGKAVYTPTHPGAILTPQAIGIKQTFLRFPSPTLPADPAARFKHFTTVLLPGITKMPRNPDGSGLGLLIYIPDSLDFPKLRNHFSFHPSCANLSFGAVDENHGPATREVRRARSHFENGRHSVILYTERAHHFFRYRLKGVKRVIFYGVPSNPVFYEEVAAFLEGQGSRGDSRCLFSRWEKLALERVVGSERVGKMAREKGGDVFEFL